MTDKKNLWKFFIFISASLLVVFLVLLVNLFLTGRTERGYTVIDPETVLNFMGKEIKPEKLAEMYKPILEKRYGDDSPDLLWVYYEVGPSAKAEVYDLVYYPVWEKETDPWHKDNLFISILKWAYYGYPDHDIHFFQISVERATGKIVKLIYETSMDEKFNSDNNDLILARITNAGGDQYKLQVVSPSEENIGKEKIIKLELVENRPVFGIIHWTHASLLVNSENDIFEQDLATDLRLLTQRDYIINKFARKSHGDLKTEETTVDRIFLAMVSIIFVYMVIKRIQRMVFGDELDQSDNQSKEST